uniref:Uncharacterized protein n=1 Tax=Arion vulgaris TaxID=1028688 RepID=A0A0B7AEH1_9EUPU
MCQNVTVLFVIKTVAAKLSSLKRYLQTISSSRWLNMWRDCPTWIKFWNRFI